MVPRRHGVDKLIVLVELQSPRKHYVGASASAAVPAKPGLGLPLWSRADLWLSFVG